MKTETISNLIFGTIAASLFGILIFMNCAYEKQREELYKQIDEEVINDVHDWETKFVIEDGYNGENGKMMFHYINEYKRNVDHSIEFVGDDGLMWRIPYPYFHITVNTNYNKRCSGRGKTTFGALLTILI
jgi:hypothetical protein